MRAVYAALLLVASACAQAVPALPGEMPAPLEARPFTVCAPEIPEAATEFAQALWGVEFSCDAPDAIVLLTDPGRNEDGIAYAGYCAGGVIKIGPNYLESPVLDLIIAHELGHALGHGHVEDRCDIMYPTLEWDSDCIRTSLPVQ